MADDERYPDATPDEDETLEKGRNGDDMDSASDLAKLQEQLEATRDERDQNRDLALRAHAELENFRKRVNREREEDARYRSASLARDLFPVIDNLDRAVHAAGTSGNADELIQGVEMVLRQFADTLGRHEIRAIPAVGEVFDANKHEALTQVPTDEHPPMTILQEAERGYTLHDRVLRPSKVIVAMAPPAE